MIKLSTHTKGRLHVLENQNLIITDQWKGLEGETLSQNCTKDFVVTAGNSISPVPEDWILDIPISESKSVLQINFQESLEDLARNNLSPLFETDLHQASVIDSSDLRIIEFEVK